MNSKGSEVTQIHGFTSQKTGSIEELCKEFNYEPKDVYALFNRFKALCAMSKSPYGIDKEVFRRGIPVLALEDDLFVSRVFEILDSDQSGSIEFEEFISAVGTLENGTQEQTLRFLFKVYDIDGDGLIDKNEMYRFFLSSFCVSADDTLRGVAEYFVDQVFQTIDTNIDGHLTLDEALEYLHANPDVTDVFVLFGRSMQKRGWFQRNYSREAVEKEEAENKRIKMEKQRKVEEQREERRLRSYIPPTFNSEVDGKTKQHRETDKEKTDSFYYDESGDTERIPTAIEMEDSYSPTTPSGGLRLHVSSVNGHSARELEGSVSPKRRFRRAVSSVAGTKQSNKLPLSARLSNRKSLNITRPPPRLNLTARKPFKTDVLDSKSTLSSSENKTSDKIKDAKGIDISTTRHSLANLTHSLFSMDSCGKHTIAPGSLLASELPPTPTSGTAKNDTTGLHLHDSNSNSFPLSSPWSQNEQQTSIQPNTAAALPSHSHRGRSPIKLPLLSAITTSVSPNRRTGRRSSEVMTASTRSSMASWSPLRRRSFHSDRRRRSRQGSGDNHMIAPLDALTRKKKRSNFVADIVKTARETIIEEENNNEENDTTKGKLNLVKGKAKAKTSQKSPRKLPKSPRKSLHSPRKSTISETSQKSINPMKPSTQSPNTGTSRKLISPMTPSKIQSGSSISPTPTPKRRMSIRQSFFGGNSPMSSNFRFSYHSVDSAKQIKTRPLSFLKAIGFKPATEYKFIPQRPTSQSRSSPTHPRRPSVCRSPSSTRQPF